MTSPFSTAEGRSHWKKEQELPKQARWFRRVVLVVILQKTFTRKSLQVSFKLSPFLAFHNLLRINYCILVSLHFENMKNCGTVNHRLNLV